MSRKTCFMIFIAAVTIILVSYVIKFSPVTGAVSSVFAAMQNPYLQPLPLLFPCCWQNSVIIGC